MSYTALYRKYRPQIFADVRGQDHVVTTLKNQIRADRIGHAYLFCGTRGTGKTSVAKIFARAVNCENPVDGEPCNECAACRGILEGSALNVIEIDAASNNGVDNIRTIRDEVAYPPSQGRYKVYIIDEVHMLSIGAFNALLKTLEEPPSYVIFILATTEVQKIPVTILSRCQQYDFRRISRQEITLRLTELLEKENIQAEEAAVRYIARKADGGMRDALSIADQCISFYLGETLTYEKVLTVIGAVDTQQLSQMFGFLGSRNVQGCISLLSDMIASGRDIMQLTTDLISYMRNALLIQTTEQTADMLDLSEDNFAVLEEDASRIREDTLMRYIRILSELTAQLRYAANRRVLLEIALIRMCTPQMERDEQSLTERIRRLEKMAENSGPAVFQGREQGFSVSASARTGAVQQSQIPTENAAMEGKNKPEGSFPSGNAGMETAYEKAAPRDLQQIEAVWKGIVAGVSSQIFKNTLLSSERMFDAQDPDQNLLIVSFKNFLGQKYVSDPRYAQELETLITEKIGKTVKIKMVIGEDMTLRKGNLQKVRVLEEELKDNIGMDVETDDSMKDPYDL